MKAIQYRTFERVIAAVLLVGMIAVIVLASWSFIWSVLQVTINIDQQLDFATFQTLFDRVIAALITLELANSVHQMAKGRHGLFQVRTVVIIGILAVVRKFILLEIETASGILLMGLGAAILALGLVYALTHWIEERANRGAEDQTPKADQRA
ncbi:phosphate-starvation-inducible PsiE family protein [Pelagibius sp.]|uniref:phosphate-starvation-inducible PsiE family protein n=1 Tax=Pelagibius sp. TaxID=1931238 RepID=UPI00262DB64B|nr:phosphate-starvation-inducible PsiE family protein [Pelagibius sp.]